MLGLQLIKGPIELFFKKDPLTVRTTTITAPAKTLTITTLTTLTTTTYEHYP